MVKTYYQDDYCTIYLGEMNTCVDLCVVVDCTHENIHRNRGKGNAAQYTQVFAEQGAQCPEAKTRPAQGLQTNTGTHRRQDAHRRRASCVERRRCYGKGWAQSSLEDVCGTALRILCCRQGRTPSLRRQHAEQCARKYCLSVPQMSHEKGRAA